MRVVEGIKNEIPVFHTGMMRRKFNSLYGRNSPNSKPYVLRSIYKALTNDCSVAKTTAEEEIDQRILEALMMENQNIIIDLREISSNGKDRYSHFLEKCSQFLSHCTQQYMTEGMVRQHLWPKQVQFVTS